MANAKRVAEIKRQLESDPKYMAKVRAEADARWRARRTPAQRAQDIKEQIFRDADVIVIPADFGTNPRRECTPIFFTAMQREAHIDAQLRAQADAIGNRIVRDLLADSLED